MRISKAFFVASLISLAMTVAATAGSLTSAEIWKDNAAAATAASKQGHYAEAEKLLVANVRVAETFPPKDARLPRAIFDLAQVYRSEGKYSNALPLYERALQIYTALYGPESTELADTLDGEAGLYSTLGDYPHAEPLLVKSLGLRQKLLHPNDPDIAESENDLGELYSATGAYDKASLYFWRRWISVKNMVKRPSKLPKR